MRSTAGTLLVLVLLAWASQARVYERCELARDLRDRLHVPPEQLATWVCIAHRESTYNTTAVGTLAQGMDHGLFQISDLFWCETGDVGGACGLDCASLLDDDIMDDYTCARRIHRAHAGLQGDGFRAWAVYAPYCSGGRVALEAQYTADCFGKAAPHVAPQVVSHPLQRSGWSWYYSVAHYKK